MARRELREILAKINYRMEWDDWDLTDAEYDILE